MIEILLAGLEGVKEYLSAHVLTCLIPAFFISGAIAALLSKGVILQYFGAKAKKWLSYSVASISGTILAVCSCTILPMFTSIYRRGAGIGPAFAFLYSGPAINLLAIVLTASVLGIGLGIARAVSAITIAVVVGLCMSRIFERGGEKAVVVPSTAKVEAGGRPKYISLSFFVLLVAILLVGASGADLAAKLSVLYILTIAVAGLLIFYYSREEVKSWGVETWWLSKKIFPILIAGVFVVGLIGGVAAIYAPSNDPQTAVGELTQPYFGSSTLAACFLASIIGAVLYMPTLLEVPIVGILFGYSSGLMAPGPALSLLLAGPSLSLPSMIVILRTVGWRKAGAYVLLVVCFSTLAGMAYGALVG